MSLNVVHEDRKHGSTQLAQRKLLNIGCGRHYDRRWINLDLESSDSNVLIHDVTTGIPFSDNEFDAVYHSHILEHLRPELGRQLVAECYRVLKPTGILRIVVPDLEKIAELYLQTHTKAWHNEPGAQTDFEWMKLELLDQLVREQSGGRMGAYMANQQIDNSEFVRRRVGDEFEICRGQNRFSHEFTKPDTWSVQLARSTRKIRENMTLRIVRWLLGNNAQMALDEGLFRSRGEVHRWMYERYSLRRLCLECEFVDFRVCDATVSQIEGFADFQLDMVGNTVRKPDSLFVECSKPPLQRRTRIRRPNA